MKNLFALILVFFSLVTVIQAQNPKTTNLTAANSNTTVLVSLSCEGTNCAGLTIDNTAGGIALTSSKYNPTVTDQPSAYSRAQVATCYNTGAKIWITDVSGITLSSGKGTAINDGERFTIYGYTNITNVKAIRDAGVSSLLYCTYYRQP